LSLFTGYPIKHMQTESIAGLLFQRLFGHDLQVGNALLVLELDTSGRGLVDVATAPLQQQLTERPHLGVVQFLGIVSREGVSQCLQPLKQTVYVIQSNRVVFEYSLLQQPIQLEEVLPHDIL